MLSPFMAYPKSLGVKLTIESILILTALACFGGYVVFVISFAVNLPNADDYDMLLDAVLKFKDRDYSILLARHGEHIVLTSRVIAILHYLLLGEINFANLIKIGNLAVPLSILLLIFLMPAKNRRVITVAPIFILLLNLQYYQSTLWAVGALQNLTVMSLVLGAFLFLDCKPKSATYCILALVLATLALLSQGNGVFVPLLAGLWLLYIRSFIFSFLFLGIGIAGLAFHISQASAVTMDFSLSDNLTYIFAFLGSPLSVPFPMAVTLGALSVLGYFVVTILKRNSLTTIYLVPAFVILTSVTNSLARIRFGVDYAFLESRYHYPALFYWAALYLIALSLTRKKMQEYVSLVGFLSAATVAILSFVMYWSEGQLRKDVLEGSIIRWHIARKGLEYPNQARATQILAEAAERGVYTVPKVSYQHLIRQPDSTAEANLCLERGHIKIEHLLQAGKILYLKGYVFQSNPKSSALPSQLYLLGENRAFRLPIEPQVRPDVRRHYKSKPPVKSGFQLIFDGTSLMPGQYELLVELNGCCVRARKRIDVIQLRQFYE